MLKSTLMGAATALVLSAAAHAGTVVNAYSVFSLDGATGGLGFHSSSTLDMNTSFSTPFVADGLAYGAGGYFITGAKDSGVLTGNYLMRLNTSGDATASEYGGSFVDWGPLAYGDDTLFASQTTFGFDGAHHSVSFYNSDLTSQGLSIDIDGQINGLAYGADSLFVSYGSKIARYSLTGDLMDAFEYGIPDIGALAFGDGKLFAAFSESSQYGWATINPDVLWMSAGASVTTDDAVVGLTFGEGKVFASTDFGLARYGLDGTLEDYDAAFPLINYGLLAYTGGPGRDDCEPGSRVCTPGGGVPEPSTWALMIVGFGGAGVALRRRRPPRFA